MMSCSSGGGGASSGIGGGASSSGSGGASSGRGGCGGPVWTKQPHTSQFELLLVSRAVMHKETYASKDLRQHEHSDSGSTCSMRFERSLRKRHGGLQMLPLLWRRL